MVNREKGYSLVNAIKMVESDRRLSSLDVRVYKWLGSYSKKFWISYLDIYGRKGLNVNFKDVYESIELLNELGYLEYEKMGEGKYGDLFSFKLFKECNKAEDKQTINDVNLPF